MRILSLKRLAPYGVAVLSVTLAALVRLELDPRLGESAPFVIFAFAVILVSWYGGFWPGLLATILSIVATDYFFVAPKYAIFLYDNPSDQIRAILFGVFGLFLNLIFARVKKSVETEREIRERFRLLVEGVKDYAIFMLDAQGCVASWNPGAERITGYRANEIVGRDFSVFFSPEDIESGNPQRILEIAATEGRYDESGWQVRRDGSRFWASGVIAAMDDDRGRLQGFTIITRDITERKLSEEKIRFFADLNQALMPLADPEEIMAAAARMLGEYLGVDRCAYAEVETNENYLYITNEYNRGETPSLVGRFSADDLGVEALRMMRSNRSFVVNDVEAEALAGRDLSAYRQTDVKALICAPLLKSGHYVARMVVSQKTPRHWEPWEVELVTKVANRCWESVARARAVRELRESEERYRAFITNSSEGILRFELEQPIPINLPEDEQIEMIFKYAYLAECNDAMARSYGYEIADQIVGARIGDLLVRSDPRNIDLLRAFRRSGFNLMDSESYEVDRYGNTRCFLNNLTGIVENGAVIRAWGTQRDITERKRAEQALRESEERLRRISEATQDSIWEIDLKTRRLWWSERVRPLFGSRPGDLQPGLEDWYERIHPEDVGPVRDRFEKYMRNDDRNWLEEYRFRRADGSYAYILDQSQKFYDESGTPILIAGAMSDITTRVQAEQALRASEERLRRISEATQDSIWELDLKTKQLWWSERVRPLFGSRPGDLQPGLEDWYDRIHPEDVERVKARFEQFMRNDERNWFDEYRFRRADGCYVHILDQSQKFYDESGTPILIAGAMSDITTRVQAEEALRASEERYRLLTELSPDGVMIAGADGTIHLTNQSMLRMLNAAPEQVVGRNLFDILAPEYLDHCRDCMSDLMTTGLPVTQVEAAFRTEDGRTIPVEVNGVRFNWKGQQFAQIVINDITRRKQAEVERERLHGEIEAERNRLWQILEQMPIGVAIAEAPSGRMIFHNREAESLGRHPLLPAGDYRDYAQYGGLREDGSPYRAEEYPLARALISGEIIKSEEMRYRRGDGTETFLSVDSAPINDSEGRKVLAVATFIDIAERKRAEESLRESEERFAKAFRASPDGLVISRIADGVILEVNDSFAALSGYDHDEMIGRSTLDLDLYVDPADRRRALAILEERNCVRDFEFKMKRRSGETRLVALSAEPLECHGERCWLTIIHDITERKQAEESLRESEERFSKAFRASPDALVISRISDGVILEANDSFISLSGYDRDEVIGKSPIDLGLYGDTADRQRMLAILKERNCVRDFEFAMKRKSGEARLITFSAEPLELHGEHCWLTIGRDITERKRAEESLRESEERFAKAFRASPDGLIITRQSDGVILEVNDSFGKMFGYASDEVVGKSWTQFDFLVDPEERLRARAILEEQDYIRDFEMAANRKSGETLLVRIATEPIELRGERCFVTIIHDITRRKQAEEALRKSEEQARRQLAYVEAIYATAPVGLCFVDTDLRYLSLNERLAEINGRSVEEHLGRTVREVILEAADTVEPVYRRVIETGEPVLNTEMSTTSEGGVIRHFIVSYYPIKNGGGRVLGVNVVVMEITERKKIEEELERLLRQEKAAREEAEAANRMKDEFLATISHELRTPLTSILGWARMLTGGGLTAPQARHALEVIAQSAQSQNRLIEDILDTSRIITGRLKLDAKPVEVEHIFHAAVDVIRPSAEAKGIDLSEVVEAPDGVVFGDANRLQQALWNLLSNAVKFTNEGGRIEARLGRAEGQIEIAVEDTGIGIDPKFLPQVFDRFRQADASTTREYGGLGIGLGIVRHIVEMHGGSVSASSPGKGQGATFKIRLPLISARRLARPEGQRAEAAAPAAKERKTLENCHRLDGVRVLLVEDNPDTLDMLKFIFDESGAEVIAATSVDEALDALERFRPDALVSDIAMPERDGYELIREVRSREPERGGKIPAVAVTAYARAEDRVRVLAAGFQMHVAKPIDPDELIAVVASLTGQIHY